MPVQPALENLWTRFCASDFALRAFADWLARQADIAIAAEALEGPRKEVDLTPYDRSETPGTKKEGTEAQETGDPKLLPIPPPPGPLRYEVGEIFCPKHGKYRCADLPGTIFATRPCPECGREFPTRVVGRQAMPQAWAPAGKLPVKRIPGIPSKTCSVPGCTKKHLAKGFCAAHYSAKVARKKEEAEG